MRVKTKRCSKCKKVKLISEFGIASPTSSGYNSWCKQCCRDASKKHRHTPSGIYSTIKGRQKYLHKKWDSRAKPFTIKRQEFIAWYNAQELKCVYCNIPEKYLYLIAEKYGSRWERLTIDCKNNDLGYSVDNIVLACDKCNITKNNMLTYEEMKYVGENFIRPKWEALIKDQKCQKWMKTENGICATVR